MGEDGTKSFWQYQIMPDNEAERLKELKATNLFNEENNPFFEHINKLAASTFQMPIAYIGMIDENFEWLKSNWGIDINRIPRHQTICRYPIYYNEMLIVPDTLAGTRFKDNKFVQESPYIRFYAGSIIHGPRHRYPIGVFCLCDHKPREFSDKARQDLQFFTEIVEQHIELAYQKQLVVEKVSYLSYYESITGLANTTLFEYKLGNVLQDRETNRAYIVSLALIDFPRLRQQMEEQSLNQFLYKLGKRLQASTASEHIAAHEGEGRFLMSATPHEQFEKSIQELIQTMQEKVIINDDAFYPRFYVGVSIFPDDTNSTHILIHKARDARETHAEQEQGLFSFYNQTFRQNINYLMTLKHRLKQTLKQGLLDVALQPIVKLPTAWIPVIT